MDKDLKVIAQALIFVMQNFVTVVPDDLQDNYDSVQGLKDLNGILNRDIPGSLNRGYNDSSSPNSNK